MTLTSSTGVIYEFIVVSIFYWIVAASIAELASAIPSSGGVYHWASVTPGKKWGRIVGFYAGYWNWLAWVFAAASMSFIFCMCLFPFRRRTFQLTSGHHSQHRHPDVGCYAPKFRSEALECLRYFSYRDMASLFRSMLFQQSAASSQHRWNYSHPGWFSHHGHSCVTISSFP
jgi:amino acid transporter